MRRGGISLLFLFLHTSTYAQTSVSQHAMQVQHFVAPTYPIAAWIGRVEGIVTAELSIAPDGKVQLVKVVPQYPILRESVESALKQWTFQPPLRTEMVKVTTAFHLDADCPQTGSNQPETNYYVYTRVTADLPSSLEIRSCSPIIMTSTSSHR